MLFLICVILEQRSFSMDIFLQIISSDDTPQKTTDQLEGDQDNFKPDWISTQVNPVPFSLSFKSFYLVTSPT